MIIDLKTLTLSVGDHESSEDGMCLIEACAYIAGEPFSAYPKCVSLLLADIGKQLNDLLPNRERQKLAPLIPYLIGTADDGLDKERSALAWKWIVHIYTPTWLRLAGLENHAATLEATDPNDALASFIAARDAAAGNSWHVVRSTLAKNAKNAARNASWFIAWDAARYWDATGDVAEDASWSAICAVAKDNQTALRTTSNDLRASFTQVYFDMVMLNKGTEPTL